MNRTRTMTVLLALIILIKSLNCVIGESVFLGGQEFVSLGVMVDELGSAESISGQPLSPSSPLHPGPSEQGCTDSGCLCKGFVEAPEVVAPEPTESLDDWSRLAGTLTQLVSQTTSASNLPHRLRPGDSLFADTSPSGRSLRQQFASLTL